MSLLEALGGRRRARRAWRQARTLAELGALTAAWLEGAIATHPGHVGRPDAETDELVPALAALNRAGLVTIGSQPGADGAGVDGRRWSQRAAVEALTGDHTAQAVHAAAARAGLVAIHHGPAPRWRSDYTQATPVTGAGNPGVAVTDFGAHHSRRALGLIFAGSSADALEAVCSARQITVIDPDWGRNDRLWPLLVDAASASSGRGG